MGTSAARLLPSNNLSLHKQLAWLALHGNIASVNLILLVLWAIRCCGMFNLCSGLLNVSFSIVAHQHLKLESEVMAVGMKQ